MPALNVSVPPGRSPRISTASEAMRRVLPMVSTAALAVSLCACSSDDSGRQFSATLGKKLRSDHVAEIDLATIGTFAWDELFVFDPYSTRDDNCRALALDLIECRTTFPAVVGEANTSSSSGRTRALPEPSAMLVPTVISPRRPVGARSRS